MTVISLTPGAGNSSIVGARKIDAMRGSHDGSLSQQWYKRPDDQRFLSMDDLLAHVIQVRERSWSDTFDARAITVEYDRDDIRSLTLRMPDGHKVNPTNWSFGQLCSLLKAPASFLRDLPAPIASVPLQYCLRNFREELLKGYMWRTGPDTDTGVELRAMTSPSYGRIYDAEVVESIMKIIDDTWKVPGTIDWATGFYDPNTPITKTSTTLYASDRDVFIFLCRDQHPIEIGKLADGSPDLLFPGFMVRNSEVGAGSYVIETMYLRGVCQNRNLWGVEGRASIRWVHSKGAPQRFAEEAHPALLTFTDAATQPVIAKVEAAKGVKIGKEREDRVKFLKDMDFSKKVTDDILESFFNSEGRPMETLWDVVQGVTAKARDIPHQDARFVMEQSAGRLMDKVAA